MHSLRILFAASAIALSLGAQANVPAEPTAVYVEGGQYTAVLNQRTHGWRLLPGDGVDLSISAAAGNCRHGAPLPAGLWLVTRDAEGRPTLTAPSATVLPARHPEQIALRACGERSDDQPHVAAPQGLIDWLTYNTGAIYVED